MMKVANHLEHPVIRTGDERDLVDRLAKLLDKYDSGLKLLTGDGQEVELPEAIVSAMAESARVLAGGDAAVVLPVQSELSPQQASRILNVSRPYVTRLLDKGAIPFHRVGSHRRIILSDLLAYKEQRDAARREELRRLSELSREMEIPE